MGFASRGVCIQGGVCLQEGGGLYSRVVCIQELSVSRGFCIQGVSASRRCLHLGGRHLEWGLSQGDLHPGGCLAPGGGGLHPGSRDLSTGGLGRPPERHGILRDMVKKQAYASYWNAFLFSM